MSRPAPSSLLLPVSSVDRLLDKDSRPLTFPGLHPEAADHLLRQADDFPPERGYEVTLQVPPEDAERLAEVREGLQHWARNQAQQTDQELRRKFRQGTKSLILALAVVAGLIILVEWLEAFGHGHLYRLFGESLVIIAWVTLWLPVETLLIDPISLRRRRALLQALSRAEVRLEIT